METARRESNLSGNYKRGTDSTSSVSCSRLHIELTERSVTVYAPVGDGVHCTPAGECKRAYAMSLVKGVEEVKEGFLVHGLDRPRNIAVALSKMLLGFADWTQEIHQRWREQRAYVWFPAYPFVRHILRMVAEEAQIETERSVVLKHHNLAHLGEVLRFAVWGKAHDFVFVPVVRESQVLSERLVKNAQRMWEINLVLYIYAATPTDAPRCARKIAEPVHRDHCRLLKR
jgi:hypothetical protein